MILGDRNMLRSRMRSFLSRKKTEIEREERKENPLEKKTSSINFELEVRKTKFPRRRTREFLFLPCLIKGGGEDTREIYFLNKTSTAVCRGFSVKDLGEAQSQRGGRYRTSKYFISIFRVSRVSYLEGEVQCDLFNREI